MTMTDEIRATNGHAKGRAVAGGASIVLPSGYYVKINRQPADVFTRAKAAAITDLAPETPPIPTQPMETEPGVWRDIPNEQDPEYIKAKTGHDQRISMLAGVKLVQIMLDIGVEFDYDATKLESLRKAYRAIGIEMPQDDRMAWFSYVLAPTPDDVSHLFAAVYGPGLPTDQQVAFQRAMFPGNVSGDAA